MCKLIYKLSRFLLILALLAYAYVIIAVVFMTAPCSLIPLIALVGLLARRGDIVFGSHGTATWADEEFLRRAGMLNAQSGIILGRLNAERPTRLRAARCVLDPNVKDEAACRRFVERGAVAPLVRLPRSIHTAVFCPTGGGKGVSFVIPHLLTCPDSTVVVDFKGENHRITAKHRETVFGHRCIALDPFRVVTQKPDSFNPLDFIDKDSPLAIDECRDLAEALVIRTGEEKERHWADSAEVWVAAFVAAVVCFGEAGDRSMQTVRGILTDPAKMDAVIKLLCASDAWQGFLARLGGQLTNYKDKELNSTLTTTNRFLRFLDTIAVAESTKSSSFDPADLRQGRMTAYLILPPDHMRAQSPLFRMWIGAMLRAVVRGGLQERNKVHLILDEAASLGRMEAIDDAVDKYRGYGVRLQFYYQSLGQLKKCFPEGQDQTLLSNTTQVYFAVNDYATAEAVSNRLGEHTIQTSNASSSVGGSKQSQDNGAPGSVSASWNTSEGWSLTGRKLLKPEEVMGLPERTAITFTPGVPPIATTLIRYYDEPRLNQQPSRWSRFATAARTLAFATLLFACGAVLAVGMFAATQNTRQVPVMIAP